MRFSTRFSLTFSKLLVIEGLYSNDPVDAGGETICGISRRAHPDWPGWHVVDAAKAKPGFPRSLRDDQQLLDLAAELYFDTYWTPAHAEEMPVPVGEDIFDIAVNSGLQLAGLLLQVAVNALGIHLRVDGQIGPKTLDAVRLFRDSATQHGLHDAVQAAHAGFYLGLVAAKPSQVKYRRGWLARALEEAGQQPIEVA